MVRRTLWMMALAGGLGLGWLANTAPAAILYSYGFDQASYTLDQGQTVNVPVYFQESAGGSDVSKLNTQQGLAAASVLLQRTLGNGVLITGITPNSLFDGVVTPDPGISPFAVDNASLYVNTLDPALAPSGDPVPTHGVMPTETPAGSDVWRVLLGTFSFTATGSPGDSATFQATMVNTQSDASTWDALYGANASYETLSNTGGLISAPDVTFTVSLVPEPGSLPLLALACVALMRRNSARKLHAKPHAA